MKQQNTLTYIESETVGASIDFTDSVDLRVAIYRRKYTACTFRLAVIVMNRRSAMNFIEKMKEQNALQGEGPYVWRALDYLRTDLIPEKIPV